MQKKIKDRQNERKKGLKNSVDVRMRMTMRMKTGLKISNKK